MLLGLGGRPSRALLQEEGSATESRTRAVWDHVVGPARPLCHAPFVIPWDRERPTLRPLHHKEDSS